MSKKYPVDYRVNFSPNGGVLSVEITCCKSLIGELRYSDEQSIVCPECGKKHLLRIQYNHFHISQQEKD